MHKMTSIRNRLCGAEIYAGFLSVANFIVASERQRLLFDRCVFTKVEELMFMQRIPNVQHDCRA